MTGRFRTLFLILAALLLVPAAYAGGAADDEGGEGHAELDLLGHTVDGFYLDFAPFAYVELPRIFLVRDADGSLGVDAFWSTAAALESGRYQIVSFQEGHGPDAAHAAGEAAEHGDVYEGQPHAADGVAELPADQDLGDISAVGREDLASIIASHDHLYAGLGLVGGEIVADFSITRHYVFGLLAAIIVALVFISLAQKYKRGQGRETAPHGVFQNMFETLIVFVRDEIARPNIGEKYARYLPFLLTAFFFILTCNLLGLVPYGAAATSNIVVTGILALCTLVIGHARASKDYWAHIFWPPGVPVPIKFILIPVEFLGIFTKHIALAIRLFANMAAGTLVILALLGLIFTFTNIFGSAIGYAVAPVSVGMTLFISVVKLLVAFIQAYVFTMLSALFIGLAVEEHGHHHEPDYVPHGTDEHHVPRLSGDGPGYETVGARQAQPAAAH